MRKIIAVALGAALASGPAAFAAHGSHVERATYTTAGGVQGVVNGSTNVLGRHLGFVQLATRPQDRTIQLRVRDANGLPVAFDVAQWDATAPDGEHALGSFCSSTPRIRLPAPGKSLAVYIDAGACPAGPSAPSTGTVVATYR